MICQRVYGNGHLEVISEPVYRRRGAQSMVASADDGASVIGTPTMMEMAMIITTVETLCHYHSPSQMVVVVEKMCIFYGGLASLW